MKTTHRSYSHNFGVSLIRPVYPQRNLPKQGSRTLGSRLEKKRGKKKVGGGGGFYRDSCDIVILFFFPFHSSASGIFMQILFT